MKNKRKAAKSQKQTTYETKQERDLYSRTEVIDFCLFWMNEAMHKGDMNAATNACDTADIIENGWKDKAGNRHLLTASQFNRVCNEIIREGKLL